MVKCTTIVIAFAIISLIKCDWVEIPQTVISDKEKLTKRTDITMYMLTTTSTTTQTPVFAKPIIKTNIIKTDSKTKGDISTTTARSPPLAKPNGINKKPSTPTNGNKLNKDATLRSSNFSQTSTTNKKLPALNSNETANTINKNAIRATSIGNKTLNQTPDALAENKLLNITASKNNIEFDEIDEYDTDDELEESVEPKKHEDDNNYSYSNFIPYMSEVQSILMKNAHKNKKSKLNVLKDLRDHLLGDIESRITSLWKPKREGRGAREYKDDSHVDFPSNEGALMTIGFLTFAVFLIKLVMQLIQAIGNKVDMADGVTTTTIIGRKRRGISDEEAVKILNYIEQFKLK